MGRIKVLVFTTLPLQQPVFDQECDAESFEHILDYIEEHGFIDLLCRHSGKRSRFYKANIGIITHDHAQAIVAQPVGLILPGVKH